MFDAAVMGVAVLAVLALALRWANRDERARQGRVGSTSAHLACEGAMAAGAAFYRRPCRSAHRTRETSAGCNRRSL